MEIWQSVEGYPDYFVSDLGRIKSCKWGKKRILKPFISGGYLYIRLTDNERVTFLIHRLVALSFISNPENKREVNHIDGNKLNNRVDNLEWNTRSENNQHAIKTDLRRGNQIYKFFHKENNLLVEATIQQMIDTYGLNRASLSGVIGCIIRGYGKQKTCKGWTVISEN